MTTRARKTNAAPPAPRQGTEFEFLANYTVGDLRRALESLQTEKKEEPPMTAAPAIDLAALASGAELTDEQIETRRGRPSKYAENPLRKLVGQARKTGKTVTLPAMPGAAVAEVVGYVRAAAKEAEHGVKFDLPKDYETKRSVVVKFQATDKRAYQPRQETAKAVCSVCGNEVSLTSENVARIHGPRDARCAGSGQAPAASVE